MNAKWKKRIAGACSLATMMSCITTAILPAQAIFLSTLENEAVTNDGSELEIGDRGVTDDGIMWQVDNTFGKGIAVRGYEGTSTTVTIPETIEGLKVTGVGAEAFKGKNITRITLPPLYRLGSSSFEGCTSLSSIVFQSKQMQIDENAFKGCTGLTSVTYYGTAAEWESKMMNNSMIASGNDDLLLCTFTDADGVKFVPLGAETAGYDHSYAEIETIPGFYSNQNSSGFEAEQVESLVIYDVYDDGSIIQRENIDMSLINFNGLSPEDVFSYSNTDFVYDVPVYYDDMSLYDEEGNNLCIPAYIGIMGDVDFNGVTDSSDASYVLSYYSHIMSGYSSDTLQLSKNSIVTDANDIYDEFAAFLADMTQISSVSDNWKMKKSDRTIDPTDASIILAFYAHFQAGGSSDTNKEDFVNERYDISPIVKSADGGFTIDEIKSSEVKPKLSVSQLEVENFDPYWENRFTVSVYLDGENVDKNWSTMGIKLKYDPRLEVIMDRIGYPDVKYEEASKYLNRSLPLAEDNSIFVAACGSYRDDGSTGTLFTCNFALPYDAQPGDLFDIEVEYVPGSLFTNNANDKQGRLMQAYLFTEGIENGYIHIEEPPVTTTATTSTTTTTITTTATTTTVTTTTEPEIPLNLGDVDGDGRIDSSDASLVMSAYAKISLGQEVGLTADQLSNADANQNGAVEAADASAILSFYAYIQTGGEWRTSISEYMAEEGFDSAPLAETADGGFTVEEINNSAVKPTLKISQHEMYEWEAWHREIKVDVEIQGADLKWSTSGIHLFYDNRLELIPGRFDTPITLGKAAQDISCLKPIQQAADDNMNEIFITTASNRDYGMDGIFFTLTFMVPDNAREGDEYKIEARYAPGSMFTNTKNDEQGRLMQAYLFTQGISNGYIRILEEPIIFTTTTETTTTTSTTTTTTETTTTTTEPTTTTTKYFASIDEMCVMAKNDYEQKTGTTPVNAEATVNDDGTISIELTDEEGNVLDTYVIDPETGVGTGSSGNEVNLPQTGNNSLGTAAAAMTALGMMTVGAFAILRSGVIRKKEEE